MKKKGKTIDESLNKIKYMMNYDSSRTLIENTEAVTEQLESPLGIAGKTAAATGGAAALGGGAGALYSAGSAASGSMLGGVAAATGLGATAAAAVAGAAALALTPLILWLVDKDKARPKTKKLFDYCAANKDKIDQVERGLDDDTIQQFSDDLYNAMKGLGTRNKMVFRVFNSLVTISDLSALITTFNEDFQSEGKGDLFEWLDSDIDISSTWNKIYIPVKNLVKKFAKQMAAEEIAKKNSDTGASTGAGTGAASGGYRPVAGTNEEPYVKGTSGQGIFKVQECLGITADGKFGPITHGKLMELAKPYRNGFTNEDIDDICKMTSPRRDTSIAPINAIGTDYKPQSNSPLKMTPLAPPTNKTTLAPGPKISTPPPKAPVPEKSGLFGNLFKRNK